MKGMTLLILTISSKLIFAAFMAIEKAGLINPLSYNFAAINNGCVSQTLKND